MAILKSYADLAEMPASQIRKAFGGKALGLAEAHALGILVSPVHLLPAEHYEQFTTAHPRLSHAEFKAKATD